MPPAKFSLDRAAEFMWHNARMLERALFSRRFAGGSGNAVVAAVRAYRNPDGGFGHACEPDVRCPDSMPLHTEIALRALVDADVCEPELATGACDFLASVAEPTGRVPIVLESAAHYPRAPHWNQPLFRGDSINPTGALVGLLHTQRISHDWLHRAGQWCWERLQRPIEEAHECVSALTFLEHWSDRNRATEAAKKVVSFLERVSFFVFEPGSAQYGITPLHLCPTPDAIARPYFEPGLIERHLVALASRQQEDGGWPIYFDAASPAAALEWRGRETLAALTVLRAYGRV